MYNAHNSKDQIHPNTGLLLASFCKVLVGDTKGAGDSVNMNSSSYLDGSSPVPVSTVV